MTPTWVNLDISFLCHVVSFSRIRVYREVVSDSSDEDTPTTPCYVHAFEQCFWIIAKACCTFLPCGKCAPSMACGDSFVGDCCFDLLEQAFRREGPLYYRSY